MRLPVCRKALPLLATMFALLLVAMQWRVHNHSSCYLDDIGARFWECQSPSWFLNLLAGPTILFILPIARLWPTSPWFLEIVLELPLVALWWWWIGRQLDYGLPAIWRIKGRRSQALLCLVYGILFIAVICAGFILENCFPSNQVIKQPTIAFNCIAILCSPTVRLWLLVFAIAFASASILALRGRLHSCPSPKITARHFLLTSMILAIYMTSSLALVRHAMKLELQRQEEYDKHRIMVRGRIVDEQGKPIYAIRVDMVSIDADGKLSRNETAYDFTEANGEFLLAPYKPGRYIVAVRWNDPPSSKHPYLARFLPGVDSVNKAEQLDITSEQHLTLPPISMKSVPVLKVPVAVTWESGQQEPNAYLLFTNSLYPQSGAVGGEALHPESDGSVLLPSGFTYQATAQVDCDGGAKIITPYSPPITFKADSDHPMIQPLHLILQGSPCKIWHPL